MQYDGGYRSYYAPDYPPPVNPSASGFPSPDPVQPSYASAPPYSDFSAYSVLPSATAPADPCYASYVQNPEPASELPPPTSSYVQTQPQFPTFQAYNPSAYPPEPMPTPSQHYTYDPNVQAATYSPLMSPSSGPLFDAPLPQPLQPYGSTAGASDRGAGYRASDAARYGSPVGEDYGRSLPSFERDPYGKRPESSSIPYNGGFGDGVYAYDGGRSEPYGARGTVPGRSQVLFDDYGRSMNLPSSEKDGGSLGRIVRAVPAGTQQDANNGVQKFRVKLLPEGGGQSTMDVLCQIGLDGIRMLDPSTSRTLRIYPLETVTRWEVIDSSTFTFWSKSSVDIDPKRIRLQSNSYTTNTILDTVTAATVQLKEMGGNDSLNRDKISSNAGKLSEQATEKKKGLIDWVSLMKPGNEEKDHWVPDETVKKCTSCGSDFGAFNRRHHCRNCGDIFCDKCTQGRIALTADENAQPVRVCDSCMAEVSQRLSNTKEAANKPVGVHSHKDFAQKLQEEMEKSRKSSSGSKSSDGSERQTMEVACPICTVHLRVQVPTSGPETIECGVCQHPFLVRAH